MIFQIMSIVFKFILFLLPNVNVYFRGAKTEETYFKINLEGAEW
jgi:hypothetical protein